MIQVVPGSGRPFEIPITVVPPVDKETAVITGESSTLCHRHVWRKGFRDDQISYFVGRYREASAKISPRRNAQIPDYFLFVSQKLCQYATLRTSLDHCLLEARLGTVVVLCRTNLPNAYLQRPGTPGGSKFGLVQPVGRHSEPSYIPGTRPGGGRKQKTMGNIHRWHCFFLLYSYVDFLTSWSGMVCRCN